MCSISKAGFSPVRVMMSNLTGKSMSNLRMYASVAATIRRIFWWFTASSGEPNSLFRRVFTSTTTNSPPYSATMSSSFFPDRQFLCRMWYPLSARKRAASSSPPLPNSLCIATLLVFSAKLLNISFEFAEVRLNLQGIWQIL